MSHNLMSSYSGAAGLVEREAEGFMYPDTCEAFDRVSQDILPGKFQKHGWERSQMSGGMRCSGSSAGDALALYLAAGLSCPGTEGSS